MTDLTKLHDLTHLTAPIPQLLADYLHQLHQVIVPVLVAQGVTPNPINAREALANMTATFVTQAPTMAKIIDTTLVTPKNFRGYAVPLRIFVPQGLALPSIDNPVAVPVMVFFHGGGGMAGSVTVYDKIYKKLAAAAQCIVVAPEYRLAPENRYPAAIDDAQAILAYLQDTLIAKGYCCNGTLIVGGDSGGGAIAATLVQDWLANKIDTPLVISHQLLIYAGLDYTLSQPSIQENAQGYVLESDKIRWYYEQYFTPYEDVELASPFWTDLSTLAYHTPHPLPQTLNVTAGYCPLRDEDIGYHKLMQQAGFDSKILHFPEMVHTFVNLENLCAQQCATMYQTIAKFCQNALSTNHA